MATIESTEKVQTWDCTWQPSRVRAVLALMLFPPIGLLAAWHTWAYRKAAQGPDATRHAVIARDSGSYAFGASATTAVLAFLAAFLTLNDQAVLRAYFDWDALSHSLGPIFEAFLLNLWVSIVAEVGIVIWAAILVVLRLLPGRAYAPIRFLVVAYIDLFRGLPALLTILLIGFGLPSTGIEYFSRMSLIQTGAIALVVVYGAYVSEIFRSALSAVSPGQAAAASSLGFSYMGTMRHVLLPQAFRTSLPSLLSWYISVLKDTSLLSVIGLMEGLSTARLQVNFNSNLSPLVGVSLCFLAVTLPLSRLTDYVIARAARSGKGVN